MKPGGKVRLANHLCPGRGSGISEECRHLAPFGSKPRARREWIPVRRIPRRKRAALFQEPPPFGGLVLGLLLLFVAPGSAAAPSVAELEFFEAKIRPVLVESCYPCHSAASGKSKGGLFVDTRDLLRKGGGTGPAVVPGQPDASLLIKAVRYADPDLQMPPQGKKLSDAQIADLEAWVKMGAPDPRTGAPAGPQPPEAREASSTHWAFQKVVRPALPAVKKRRWVQNPIDAFVLAGLEARSFSPNLPADRRTLFRRVSYDVTGLPPEPAEVEAFVADRADDAYERLLDRLLASPQFGERWGRHWLDVARYADTKGYLAGGEERRYAFSHTYRDYVIRAFNEDKPYPEFLQEQIAADRLVSGEDRRALAALGFLTLGRRFLNNQNDIIDDRIDVVMRGTQGLTVSCARCHDHKFDPISMPDYYALHGVFASSEEPAEKPLLGGSPSGKDYEDYLGEVRKIEAEVEVFKEAEVAKFAKELRQQIGDYLSGAHAATALTNQANFDTWAGERKLNPKILRRWMAHLDQARQQHDPIFGPWLEFAALPDDTFAAGANGVATRVAAHADPARPFNPALVRALAQAPTSLVQVANIYTKLGKDVEAAWKAAQDAAAKDKQPAPEALADAGLEGMRRFLYQADNPINLPKAEARRLLARRLGEGSAPLRNKIEQLNWTHPGAPARAMALVDSGSPRDSRVLLRGNPNNPGPAAPRRFLEVLSAAAPLALTNGSGRLDLARAIASRDNPLTARVHVNRVWMHLFGQGLVRTPGDFGIRTTPPVQRDLLDFLAARFMEQGWSTKELIRFIALSATYQQSSVPEARQLARDPDNHYLHFMPRRRLDFEALRDTLLAVSGRLDRAVGGLPVDILKEPFVPRRTVYAFIERQNLPGVFRTFDFASPDVSVPQRFHTTVPQQALFLMNSPFVIEQARALAVRPEVRKVASPRLRAAVLVQLAWQRPAQPAEVDLALRFLETADDSGMLQPKAGSEGTKPGGDATLSPTNPNALDPWERLAQVVLLANELMFVD